MEIENIKEIITYDQYGMMAWELCRKIESSKKYTKIKYVYGLPRGGLPLAVHMSHRLGLALRTSLSLKQKKREQTLIVDDVADTGRTLKSLFDFYEYNFITATLHYKKRSKVKPTFYLAETKNWIVYPWEDKIEKPNREGYNIDI